MFASADALLAEWVDAVLPDLTVDTLVLRTFLGLAVGGTVLAAQATVVFGGHDYLRRTTGLTYASTCTRASGSSRSPPP